MKVKAIKEVHIRANEPYRRGEANKKGILYPGFEIEVADEVQGQEIDHNSLWYKDKNGDYYWSGGFEKTTNIILPAERRYIDYNNQFSRIGEEILEIKGKQKRIAVIDSGIELNHPDLNISLNNCFDYSYSQYNFIDKIGHGTHCAGLIAGNTTLHWGVVGIAPLAELFILKSRDEVNKYTELRVSRAIEKAIELNVDIISMSFKLYPDGSQEVKKAIEKAIANDILVVAAAGNNAKLITDEINFPASIEGVLAIGSMDKEYYTDNMKVNDSVDFIMPKEDYYSLSIKEKGYYETLDGSSMATALISGLTSSLLHFNYSSEPKFSFVRKKLNALSPHLSKITHDPFTILKTKL